MWVPKDYEEDYRTADLAILELAKAVPSSIRPIKLATPSTKLPSKVTVAGWGDDKPMADYTTIVSNIPDFPLYTMVLVVDSSY